MIRFFIILFIGLLFLGNIYAENQSEQIGLSNNDSSDDMNEISRICLPLSSTGQLTSDQVATWKSRVSPNAQTLKHGDHGLEVCSPRMRAGNNASQLQSEKRIIKMETSNRSGDMIQNS